MRKRLLHTIIFLLGFVTYGQLTCPSLTSPQNGETDVAVNASISWNAVEGVPGYILSIGTTPGGNDIVNRQGIGSTTTYQPPLGLPSNTDIHVTITLFFFNRDDVICQSGSFRTEEVTSPPDCSMPVSPLNGAENVNVGSPIIWEYAPKATGYRLTLGTTPGGNDILNGQDIVEATSYRPDQDLPADQEIFVNIVPYNINGPTNEACTEYSFTTGSIMTLPGCASLTSPANGAVDVPLTPLLEWSFVPEATGYRLSIGSSPFENDVLDNLAFTKNSTLVIDFEPNRTFFATVVPFNEAGEAIGCAQSTFSTGLGCEPFLNEDGELISIAPEIDFPDIVSFCQNDVPYTIATNDTAEGYRWFKIHDDDSEELLSNDAQVEVTQEGTYRYEAYNTIAQSGNVVECARSKEFELVSSEIAKNIDLAVEGQNKNIRISVSAEGNGDYEYALDNRDGPYQNSTIFENVPIGPHTVYVRDKNGCGIAEESIEPDLTLDGFPKFFTPNGDGVNDFWQFVPPPEVVDIPIKTIHIFDRYGRFLVQIDPSEKGWDGSFSGKSLPSADYWFRAFALNREEVRGHFSLKR